MIALGSTIPAFALHGDGDRVAAARAGERPWILAFAPAWRAPSGSSSETAAIRAHLRGLGATLIVLADSGVWSFGADDDVERWAARSDALVADIAHAARACGVAGADGAVVVVDADARVRFAHVIDARDAAPTAPTDRLIADALAAATDALYATPPPRAPARTFTRREWALTSLVAGFAFAFLRGCGGGHDGDEPAAGSDEPPPPAPPPRATTAEVDITLVVNGESHPLRLEPRVTLLAALRDRLGLTGTKHGCDGGDCGACTIAVDNRAVLACSMLAVAAQGMQIVTIEGVAAGESLHPMQAAFVKHDALQCGHCTPGQIMSALVLLGDGKKRTDDELRAGMSGNLCRCGAYPNILAAIRSVQRA